MRANGGGGGGGGSEGRGLDDRSLKGEKSELNPFTPLE